MTPVSPAGGRLGRPQAHRAKSRDSGGKGTHGGNRLFPPCSNICRCTGYVNIVEAIRAASEGQFSRRAEERRGVEDVDAANESGRGNSPVTEL